MGERRLPMMFLTVIVGSLVIIAGCDDVNNLSGILSRIERPVITKDYVYPLEVGNRWEYSGMSYETNFEPDSIASLFSDTMFIDAVVNIVSLDTLFDSIEVYCLSETTIIANSYIVDTSVSDIYMNNTDAGFYLYGYSGDYTGVAIPIKINSGYMPGYPGRQSIMGGDIFDFIRNGVGRYSSISGISDEYYDPPWLCLKYPLTAGAQWTLRNSNLFPLDKKIVEYKNIEVPAGDFYAFGITLLWDFNEDGQWDNDFIHYDYICEYGLIARSTIFEDIMLTDVYGEDLGMCDSYDEIKLTAYQLAE